MGSMNMEGNNVEIFEVGPCENSYQLGFLIGQRFSKLIRSRLATDLILQNQLLPFAQSPLSTPLIHSLSETNRKAFPGYWDELRGTSDGSGVPFLQILLLNFRKEILPFIRNEETQPKGNNKNNNDDGDDCSDILVVNDSMAIAAHNEDANVALVGHTYLIKATLFDGTTFTAYTYAGELPSCAFGFNSHGVAFTLNSVPPTKEEIVAGGIGRNFISRDLLGSKSIGDALTRISSSEASVGHSYNLVDTRTRRILNVETASRYRVSVLEVGETPFFHANMYLHLHVNQAHDENSLSRQKRAASLPKGSKSDYLELLGDMHDKKYPIYMTGPLLHTLCTAVIDVDERTLSIIQGNPKKNAASYVFSMS
nr:Acyl-coenzyme A:6-aminopenicillanic-acid-acyltransferase [Ipomoea batatas]